MQKTIKLTLKGKPSGNGQVNRIFILKKKLNPRVVQTLSWGYIHVHVYNLYGQTSLLVYVSQISGPLVLWFTYPLGIHCILNITKTFSCNIQIFFFQL